MFALSTAASIALGGMFWAWALHGGDAALEPRNAARIFGWLCIACTSIGLFFALRGKGVYDRGPGLVAALATTLLTGCGVLYLSYFQWQRPLAFAEVAAAPALTVREVKAPEAPRVAALSPVPAPARAKAAQRPKPTVAKVAHASEAPPGSAGDCAGLRRLAAHQCLKCSGESGLSAFFCEENARAEYCVGRDGTEPGCPWHTSSSAE